MHREMGEQKGELNPYWKGGKTTYQCLECGADFQSYASERARGGAQFCSRECWHENKRRRVVYDCETCGCDVEKRQFEYDRENHHFCSTKCAGIWKSVNRAGENSHLFGIPKSHEHRKKLADAQRGDKHYNWKGGMKIENQRIRNQMDYREWRTKVFERDDYTCVRCGSRNGNGKRIDLESHHILAFADYPEERFAEDNGVTWCLECHDAYHRGDSLWRTCAN